MARQRHLQIRSGGYRGISPLTLKKKSKESLIRYHLLQCFNSFSSDKFTILARENKKYLREIKKSILIKRDQPVLNN